MAGLLLFTFTTMIYLPLIIHGGIIVDDWGDIYPTLSCQNFYECYRSWFPLFSNRPLAPLPITSLTMLFGLHFSYYLLLNSIIFLLALAITALIINSIAGVYEAFIFLFLACIPIIALPVIASPINQSTATFAFLYWSLSLASLQRYCLTRSKLAYITAYGLLLCGFLTYEVILPLLSLTLLLPYILNKENLKSSPKKYLIKYLLPILFILMIVTIWQKALAPYLFGIDHSRLVLTVNSLYASILSWLDVFTNQIPNLFLKTKSFYNSFSLITSIIFSLGLCFAYCESAKPYKPAKFNLRYFFAGILCLAGSSLIFILSGTTAESGGYQARGLSSTWLSLAILFSGLAGLIRQRIARFVYLVFLLIFGLLSTLSFSIQRDGYVQSWRLQNTILTNVLELSEKYKLPRGAIILGVVPQFIPNNYNDEIVFSQPWDFGAALSILSKNYISEGYPIDPNYSKLKGLMLSPNGVKGTNWGGTNWKNLWLYKYDQERKMGDIVRILGENDLKDNLLSLGYLEDFNGQPLIRPEQPIFFYKKIVNEGKFIGEGWSTQEPWGRWSNGPHSQLMVPLPTEDTSALKITFNAFITTSHPNLNFKVSINGSQAQTYAITKVENNLISISIPSAAKSLSHLKIDFDFLNPVSPKELGIGTDERKLGIGITALSFTQ
jgi:hypothetical protein